jgi:hypothetical protein
MSEAAARRIFEAAINEGRAAELLEALFNNATATVGPDGKLVIIDGQMLTQFMETL